MPSRKRTVWSQLFGTYRSLFWAVNHARYNLCRGTSVNKSLASAILVGSMGGFVFGFDLGALSAATQSLRAAFALAPGDFGLTIAASIWGTVVGALLAGRFADEVDRRTLIAWCALIYAASAVSLAMPVAASWFILLTARFLCGVAIGGLTVGCPLYLSEIAPITLRGRIVGVFQVQVGVGVIAAFTVGSICSRLVPAYTVWKWTLGVGAIPAGVLFLAARFMPRTRAAVDTDLSDVSAGHNTPTHSGCLRQRLFLRKNTRLLLLATSVAIFNQLSGVNILLLYMLDILASAGVSVQLGHRYTILISSLSLATTVLGMAFVDRLGRKPLLSTGSLGMAACLVSLGLALPYQFRGVAYVAILVAYNAFFAFSQGTVVWVYLSELFPPGLRGPGQGFGSSIHWIANALLISFFPKMAHGSSVWVFYAFASMMILQTLVIWIWYPETSGTELGSFVENEKGILRRRLRVG